MVRIVAATIVVLTLFAPSVRAEDRPGAPVAPTAAVAAAWRAEAPAPSITLRALIASYGAAQGFDMATTIMGRRRGAVEANPLMQGNYARAVAVKAALSTATVLAIRGMDRHHRRAAIVTMIAANAATVAVAARNLRVSSRLAK